jgi:MFS family permease
LTDFRQAFAALLALFASVGLLVLGNGLLATLIAVRLDAEQIAVERIGLIMSCYSIGFVFGTILVPRLIARVGHIRAYAGFAAVATSAALIHAMLVEPLTWALLRILSGFAAAALFTIVESWINAGTGNAIRGQVLSAYLAVVYLAQGASQFLLTLIDPRAFQSFSLIAILLVLSLVPLAWGRVEAPVQTGAGRLGLIRLIRISPVGVAGCFGSGMITGAFAALGPVYARSLGASLDQVGQLMMVAILAGFALQFPLGRLSDRFDRRTVFLGTAVGVAAVGAVLAAIGPASMVVLMGLIALFGGFAYAIYPLGMAHANDFMEPAEVLPASAGLLLVYGAGAALGPVCAAPLMESAGAGGLFLFVAATGVALVLFTLYRMSMRQALPPEQQGIFAPVPQATPAALELSPRAEAAADALSHESHSDVSDCDEALRGAAIKRI